MGISTKSILIRNWEYVSIYPIPISVEAFHVQFPPQLGLFLSISFCVTINALSS